MAEERVAWPILKGGEMSDLISYLLSIRRGSEKGEEPSGKRQ